MSDEENFINEEMEILKEDPRFYARDLTKYVSVNEIMKKPLIERVQYIVILILILCIIIAGIYSLFHMESRGLYQIIFSIVGFICVIVMHMYIV